jgi:hypothetical protein
MNVNMQSQNQPNQNQQKAMLSAKNLTIIDDQLSKEALNFKKMNMYSNACNDQQLKAICQKAAQMHKKHFDSLYNYLHSHNKPAQMQ